MEGRIGILHSMRDMRDRKGGGLLCAYRRDEKEMQQKGTRSKDILHMEGKIGDLRVVMVVVYLRTGNEGEVGQYNELILGELGEIVEEAERVKRNLILLGDFNGHLGFLGHQNENRNAKLINEFMENQSIMLLNINSRCEGTYTWEREECDRFGNGE